MNKKLGVVGLGIMGSGIASNFLKKGYSVFVWNRTPEKIKKFVELGAAACAIPAEVAKNSDVVFEVTANDESSKAVWLGKKGILSGATSKTICIANATLSIKWVDELIQKCKTSKITFFDMAMTGGRIGAETGSLTLLCGGDESVLENIKPTLDAIAKKIFYFGPEGQGMRYKLILNFLQAVHVIGFGQAMKIAKANAMDLKKVSDALVERPGGIITGIAQRTYFQDPDPITFSIEWILKDLTYAKKFAKKLDASLLDDVLLTYQKAKKKGFANKDWASVNKLLE